MLFVKFSINSHMKILPIFHLCISLMWKFQKIGFIVFCIKLFRKRYLLATRTIFIDTPNVWSGNNSHLFILLLYIFIRRLCSPSQLEEFLFLSPFYLHLLQSNFQNHLNKMNIWMILVFLKIRITRRIFE